jgi:hypothetical protein
MDVNPVWNPTSLVLFLVFFIPGFISQKVYALLVSEPERNSSTVIINAMAYSSLTFAITSPLIWLLVTSPGAVKPAFAIVALLVVFAVIPVLLPVVWLQIRQLAFIRERTISPIKRPWDYVFTQPGGYWAVITFKNGSKIAGIYRDKSFSSWYPNPEQIYLEKVWNLNPDGSFDGEVPDSKGAIIMGEEILTVELFSLKEADHE